jgi:hypothetical protein
VRVLAAALCNSDTNKTDRIAVRSNIKFPRLPKLCTAVGLDLVCLFVSENILILLDFHSAGDKIDKMRWAGPVARIGTGRGVYRVFLWENLKGRDHWGDPGVYGRIILRLVFRKWDVGVWIGLSWLRIEAGGGHL